MDSASPSVAVREADLGGTDADAVRALVHAYLVHTENEKAVHLGAPTGAVLPEPYRAEVEDPAAAYAGSTVLLAELHGSPVGVAVVGQKPSAREIKRLWVDPGARGHRIGSALMDAALGERDRPIRLTVWDWRDDAIRLYRRRGFVDVPSWDDRPRLLCLELPPAV